MWPNTRVTKLLKIKYPIIQAPMAGGITTPELIASVSNAGGLGSLAAGYMSPESIRNAIVKIRSLTDKPFAVNLFIPEKHHASKQQIDSMVTILKKVCAKYTQEITTIKPPFSYSFAEQIQVILEEKIPIFSFTFGIPDDSWLKKLKINKVKLLGTATNLSEAILLERKGIDMIVAQGCEAGGHRGSFLDKPENALIGNFALIPQIVDHVKIPVIAAGAIMDERAIVAALIFGASAVQMGTAFLTCPEAGTHTKYKKLLLSTTQDNTALTRAFSGKLARGIKNKFMAKMELYQNQILDYPIQNALTRQTREIAAQKGLTDYMSLFAGQAAYLSRGIAADKLIRLLDSKVKGLLSKNL